MKRIFHSSYFILHFSFLMVGLILGEGMAFAQTDPFPAVNYRAYMGNMIVVAKVMENGAELDNVVLAAYDANGVIRGKAKLKGNGKTVVSILVYGDTSGEEIHFAVSTDGVARHQNHDTFSYLYNGQLGTKKNPHIVVLNGFAIADAADNTEVLTTWNSQTCDVTLGGRTLYKDGTWNTLCLPFDVTLAGSILEDAEAYTLSSASIEAQTLTLNFGDAVTKLTAGVPYLIKWTKPDGYDDNPAAYDLKEPTFSNVTVQNTLAPFDNGVSGDGRVQFIGTYSPVRFDSENLDVLVLGQAGLFYPNGLAMTQVGACRAYFRVGTEGSSAPVLRTVMNFGGTTDVLEKEIVKSEEPAAAEEWFDLSGRRLETEPTVPGIYIRNGRKYIVKR